jgi:ectoine hydroxylase-related dioxygenase (phytanoyl-CoA dioxygenase family)
MSEPSIDRLTEEFRDQGFVHVRGVLSPDEVTTFRMAVDEAVAVRKARDMRRLHEKSPYEQSFIQCQYLWEDMPQIRPLTFHPRVTGIAAALIGAPRLRLWHDQALYKEPGGRETDAHQDHPYWPIAEDDTLTAWIALVPVDETTGCMGYVPGSHRGPRQFVNIFTEPGSGAALLGKFPVAPTFVPCAAGDVIYHHGSTAHVATANRSGHMRCVYTAIYFRDGATRSAIPKHHPSVDRAGIGVGEEINSAVTPVVWPLEGSYPAPVPWPENHSARGEMARRLGIVPDGTLS